MNTSTLALFNSLRVNEVLQSVIQDPRLLPAPMVWASRIVDKPAPPDEIMARFYGQVYMADIIADDAKAGVYDAGAFQMESNKVPNFKTGIKFTQAMLAVLDRMKQYNGGSQMDLEMFEDWQVDAMVNGIYGVELRKEQVRIAMLMDEMVYDRLGVKITGGNWGMYPDLKITVSLDWSNVSATGLTDICTARRIARIRYGKELNRMSLSTIALQNLTKQTEFINQAKTFGFGMFNGVPSPAIPLQSDGMLATIVAKLIMGGDVEGGGGGKFTIEVDDRRAWTKDSAGVVSNQAMQPITRVILTNSDDDGNTNIFDFAQDVVTESIVASLVPSVVVGSMNRGFGPMGYVTASDSQLNAPGIIHWTVDRGFPRRKQLQCSACLNVGNFTDPISTAIVFPY